MSKDQEATDQSIMLMAMQQQFERMNLMFGEARHCHSQSIKGATTNSS